MKIELTCECGNTEIVEIPYFSTDPFDKFVVTAHFNNAEKFMEVYFHCKKCRDYVYVENLCEDNVDY